METTQNILFITFQLAWQNKEFETCCCGCREIVVPDYKKPVHIKGLMDFNHRYIPVVDPNVHFCGKSTPITDSTCILVVSHNYEYRELETAILIQDIDEIMNLVAGSYKAAAFEGASYNIRFVLGLSKDVEAGNFLTECHLSLSDYQRRKHLEEDFITFKDIMSGDWLMPDILKDILCLIGICFLLVPFSSFVSSSTRIFEEQNKPGLDNCFHGDN